MIKIEQPSSLSPSSRSHRKKSGETSDSGSFSDIMDSFSEVDSAQQSPPSDATATTSPIATLDGLLSIQEVNEDVLRRRQQIDKAHHLLDTLESLRTALLAGMIPAHLLRDIEQRMADMKREPIASELIEIIDDIELRAAVELAKWRMQR